MEINKNPNDISIYINNEFAGKLTLVHENNTTLKIPLVYVDPNFRGHNLGSVLVEEAVKGARKENKKLLPVRTFALHEFNKHPEYNDVLSE